MAAAVAAERAATSRRSPGPRPRLWVCRASVKEEGVPLRLSGAQRLLCSDMLGGHGSAGFPDGAERSNDHRLQRKNSENDEYWLTPHAEREERPIALLPRY